MTVAELVEQYQKVVWTWEKARREYSTLENRLLMDYGKIKGPNRRKLNEKKKEMEDAYNAMRDFQQTTVREVM